MDFSRDTVFRLYSEVSYPGPYPLRAPWLPTPSDRNVTNAPENIVRTKREKIVTHYTSGLLALSQPQAEDSCISRQRFQPEL